MWTKSLHGCAQQLSRVIYRTYRITSTLPAKMFIDSENQFAHNVLSASPKPYQIFRSTTQHGITSEVPASIAHQRVLQTDETATAVELYADFAALVNHCVQTATSISDARFAKFTQQLCNKLHRLNDEQLIEMLRMLTLLPTPESTKSPNYMQLWNTLDIECCRRIEGWSSEQLLLVCDGWYQLGLARIGDFVWEALRKLGRKVRKMPPEQLVQSMFLCNIIRRPLIEMFEYEVNLARCAQQMTLEELSVMGMGFFKTQTPIRNPELLTHLYKRLQAELPTVADITLVALLKVLRYSSKLPHVDCLAQLLEALRAQVERVSLLSCLHMALMGCELQTCDDVLIECVLKRFERELPTARLKDIERISLVIALFNITTSTGVERRLCERLPAELRKRVTEITRYPRCYTNCLQFLSMRGICDNELLAVAMEQRFLRHAYNSTLPGREYFHLDALARLQGDAYTGALLSDKQRRNMGKLYTQYIPQRNTPYKLNKTDHTLLEIKECIDLYFRANSLKHVLPHYDRCDLVICYDRQQRCAIPVDEQCPADYSGELLTRRHLLGDKEAAHIDTLVLVIGGWNNVIRDKQRHTGQFDMKLKQLRQLGHIPVVIYWHEWHELETTADRQSLLKRRLSTAANI